MNDDLVLICDDCGRRFDATALDALVWPLHCGQPLRLANTTDRDGNAIERAKAAHPSNGDRYESELP